ncbi:hypothetical protein KFL_000590300 [Klebsormidium nitens]|uniref:Uncharacterized protein n=1 Tax=Klebsormidium nitens TaxID=105231 RepID=A0A1Y1HVW8_KLENI|nr:hypothetical protein KFL_000590300 [Klebsormidium nitens]|eukprot:GAQ80677.1 hypothetical protein KFL_000590300 [Klebsormidium nitens]
MSQQTDRTFDFGGTAGQGGQQQQAGYADPSQQGYGQTTGGGNPGAFAQMGSGQADYQSGYQSGYQTGYQAGYGAAYAGGYTGSGDAGAAGDDMGDDARGDVTTVSGEEGSAPGERRGEPRDVKEIPVKEGPLDPGAG